ncbi:hypothetical protein F2P56_005557 [Juglans regia]|uniref:Uncharacterized protein LOC108985191 isoform X1 n=2 Tax=Juglans regia TaxID=51240 RepID=A0A2I4E0M4_JUGRE|nr:uncharacterized protein LOC108985191 isoform X1 [Juglans regia]XP_018812945.1 uncharacterized protein LOC108985191 isoform X1 [Juglans regia]XP_018812950.1 uncharacterized protein LOC108985191 isoform X1 [Juglans regia]XP_018812957.1 uncharacterized protein LOC108985191 isoform X1 [Juglans regia]KAF5479052.1 hypothetical protein F2P56_005557 [Juglans regia]
MNLDDLNKVWEIKALKKPGEDEARKILERIAKQVQPIMRRHKWRVKILSEFCPNNPSLLGLNVGGGVHVKLRLRRPNRDCNFFPFDQVLDTMLHELCHNAHGPHNASFYRLWDELRKECEELMAKGITGTGEGFDLPGRRLGGFSRQPPLSSLKKTALEAAEKRARLGSLLPSGPKRLGGDSTIMVALSPIQAAAMAAERRLQDDIWCGSQSCEASGDEESSSDILQNLVNMEQMGGSSRLEGGKSAHSVDAISRKRSQESDRSLFYQSSNDHLESNLDASTPCSMLHHENISQKRICKSDNTSFSQSTHRQESDFMDLPNPSSEPGHSHDTIPDRTLNPEEPLMWECGTCTLLNPPLAPICELCSTQRPKDIHIKYKIWPCKFCTLENSVELEKCSACGQWRYSRGAPVSMPAPNVGT